eukprot:CAMPEP_0204914408 /NCGR_PEP_ID=MMETSP1397-20131031/12280_1 /ASSEMBLY_ACC=CAM_ASM_000891 /TAXON_ID=49980 /ORGANISM="Climacostomum Climacostomum virens, Strain Stock W-24" /LENGTH=41 /DNA_ID= /DNA_START= /DNA_END= /DNA_ORIENTATION=
MTAVMYMSDMTGSASRRVQALSACQPQACAQRAIKLHSSEA